MCARAQPSWGASPSYLLRKWTVLRELRGVPPGRLLEVGCGAGDLLASLVARGFDGSCVETSEPARALARARFAGSAPQVPVVGDLAELEGRFDLVVACEVLEHIEDDLGALSSWVARLRPGGHLLLTVPAHPTRFGASDVWAGHFRRYRRRDLESLARLAGIAVGRLICFGYPLGNLIEPIRAAVHARRLRREAGGTASERTARSGVERGIEARLAPPPELVLPFCWLQVPFYRTELGTGFLLLGTRP